MSSASVPVLAGIASTVIFVGSTLPMLTKAVRTRDMRSYSLGNLALANVGNAVHSVYVFSLPPGPLWALHGFNLASTAFMLLWYVRFEIVRSGQTQLDGVDHDRAPVGHGELREDGRDVVVGGLG